MQAYSATHGASGAPASQAAQAAALAAQADAPSGRELVEAHTRGLTTDLDAVARDLKAAAQARPAEAAQLVREAVGAVKADDRAGLVERLKAPEAQPGGGGFWSAASGWVHGALDVAGFVPGLGAIPDLLNAGIYAAEGDMGNAAMSAVAAVPAFGDAAKGASLAVRGTRAAAGQVARHGDEAASLARQADHAATAARQADEAAEAAQAARRAADRPPVTGAHTPNLNINHNGYTYKTDAQGRVNQVSGQLTLNKGQTRNQRAQLEAGGADRLPTDQGGHFIARQFDGPREAINHFAQNGNFNMGAYRSLEKEWDRALQAGQQVHVTIVPRYKGDSLRPDSLVVRYAVDGNPVTRVFNNVPGGR